jgi:hypothetical protein
LSAFGHTMMDRTSLGSDASHDVEAPFRPRQSSVRGHLIFLQDDGAVRAPFHSFVSGSWPECVE